MAGISPRFVSCREWCGAKPDVSNIVVAQKYEVSKMMGISKSVRNEQLNENSSTCSARRFLVMGKFGT